LINGKKYSPLHFSEKGLTPLQGRYIIQSISLKAGVVMSALSLRLPDSVHRYINDRTYQQWAEVVQGVDLTLCPFAPQYIFSKFPLTL
jgi:hypothetical protein